MNLQKMISELQAERERLDHAIEALERLTRKPAVRRGRPPGRLEKELTEARNGKEDNDSTDT
ncbi:MAG TPA: hypothetical protein VH302_14965 [Bryobacteraceae bacterium]|jgi:hypothetical protein|nr:hypothetical protein [Bryobacteraceae bacterium]